MSLSTEASAVHNKDNPFPARLTENRLLNGSGSIKDTRHYVVDIAGSGLTYTCGDSLGVYPTNRPEDVEGILHCLGASGEEMVMLPKMEQPVSLREALSSRLALAQPTPKFLKFLREKVGDDPAECGRLDTLLDPANKDDLKGYLEEREFLDLLQEFPKAEVAPQELVQNMRKLMPRLYSIASSPTRYPDEVHLTVATVEYSTNDKPRVGVCSTFLRDRAPLHEPVVPVFVASSHFGLPQDSDADLIMVGPGTGIAPFRAFVQERLDRGGQGRLWVFFGDQHEKSDYLYGEEWEGYRQDGTLARLDLAWSRDQDYKVYVQDRMAEAGEELWSWLQSGAYFYVCGDAKRMAKDVDATLHHIAEKHGGLTPEQAKDYVKALKKEKRYQRDVY